MFGFKGLAQIWPNASFLERFLIVGGIAFFVIMVMVCLYYLFKRIFKAF